MAKIDPVYSYRKDIRLTESQLKMAKKIAKKLTAGNLSALIRLLIEKAHDTYNNK